METINEVAEHDQRHQSPGSGAENLPDKGLDACLRALLLNIRNMTVCGTEKALHYFWQPEPQKTVTMLNVLRSLLYFNPTDIASKIRSHSDAQNLFDLLFHVSSWQCSSKTEF